MRLACYRDSPVCKAVPSEKRWASGARWLAIILAFVALSSTVHAEPAPEVSAAIEPPVRLPPGSRRVADGRFSLARGIGEATAAIEARLRASGAAYERLGPVRVRGLELTRFLSADPSSSWLALHVSRKEGRTFLDVVPRQAPLTNPRSSR